MIPWPDLPPPPVTGEGRHDAAVVVAIEDYAFLPDVPGARANGRDWARWLRDTRGVPRVRTLTDEAATRESVAEAIAEARRQRQSGGLVWVVFIGHGAPGGQLLGADAQATATSLTHRRLDAEGLIDERTVAVLDACHASRAAPDGLQPVVPGWVTEDVVAPPAPSPTPSSSAAAPPPRTRGRPTVLLAAQPEQVAGPLPDAARPAFSYLVLGALRGWGDADDNGVITASEAVAYADGVLFDEATDRVQTPVWKGSDRVLGRGTESPPRRTAPAPIGPPAAPPAPTVPAPPATPTARVTPRPRARPPLPLFPRPKDGRRRPLLPLGRTAPAEARTEATPTGGLLATVVAAALALVGMAFRAHRA